MGYTGPILMEVKVFLMPNNIPKYLDEKRWSIYKLCQETGLTYNTVHSLAKAVKIPDGTAYGTLKRIAQALGVGIDDLESKGNQDD